MLFGLLFLLLTTLPGLVVANRLRALRGAAEHLGVGMVVGLLLQLWLPFLTSRIFGIGSGPWLALVLCVPVGALAGHWLWMQRHLPAWQAWFDPERMRRRLPVLLFLALIGVSLGWMFYTHSLQPKAEGLCSAGVAWEDQSYHAMLASSFLWSGNLEALEYPHFTGWPLGYPFLPDLLAATLGRLGMTLGAAFWLSAWYAGLTLLVLAWVLLREWLGSERRALLALGLFLFAGGLGWVDFAREALQGTVWPETLIRHDYVNGWELGLNYHNPLTGVLLPMRTSLIGMPIALAVLLLFTRMSETHRPERRLLVAAGVLMGLLPLVHAHSFLVLGFVGVLGAMVFFRPKTWLHILLWLGLPMLLLALPQIAWTRSQIVISEPSFIRWQPGWMCDAKTFGGWLFYWLHNAAPRLPLALGCWFFAPTRMKKLTAPLLGLLVLGNLVSFQPFAYDNIKLFAFADLAIAALCVLPLAWLWRKPWWGKVSAATLALLLTASGALSIWRETRLSSVIADWPAVAFAEMVRANTPPRAIFLTSGELTHPVPVLTGRPLVLGYTGWLGQHGVPIGDRERDVREMFEGGPQAGELLKKYHVSYIVVGPSERRNFPTLNEKFIASVAKFTIRQGEYALYELRR